MLKLGDCNSFVTGRGLKSPATSTTKMNQNARKGPTGRKVQSIVSVDLEDIEAITAAAYIETLAPSLLRPFPGLPKKGVVAMTSPRFSQSSFYHSIILSALYDRSLAQSDRFLETANQLCADRADMPPMHPLPA